MIEECWLTCKSQVFCFLPQNVCTADISMYSLSLPSGMTTGLLSAFHFVCSEAEKLNDKNLLANAFP